MTEFIDLYMNDAGTFVMMNILALALVGVAVVSIVAEIKDWKGRR